MFAKSDKSANFANAKAKAADTEAAKQAPSRRDGRVVDCGGLENR